MLKRKIYSRLAEWKQDSEHKPIIIKGCRQCGKTFAVLEFAKVNYENVLYINFLEDKQVGLIFRESLNAQHIISSLSALYGDIVSLTPYKTCIIFDEIQQCPEARTALKFLSIDGRYDIICTGSLLGVSGYASQVTSIPVGYEHIVDMYPLDFEEWLWANGIKDDIIQLLKDCLNNIKPIPSAIHNRMRQLMLQYIVIGGMPEVVADFVKNKDYARILRIQQRIVRDYQDDVVKYALQEDKTLIKECFKSIPLQLSKENKKFQYSLVRKRGTANMFRGCLQWLEDAGIVHRCYNLHITELPLEGNAIHDQFKVYMADSGLFVSMLEQGTQFDILQGNLLGYKGAIFENALADIFSKMERRLYYFRKESGLELDFIIRYRGQCTPIEVKATTGNAKSLKTTMAHPEKYHVYQAIKLGDYNIGQTNNITIMPLYMAFLLTDT
ncbi:MAG: ATP-binding protein [Paludibacteraceae bacterium]|nr:ATP-binding protein [Paludibacteraceae bacterium]